MSNAQTPALPFSAGGNEPGWQVELRDGTLSLSRMGEKGVASWPLPAAEGIDGGARYAVPGGPVVTVREAICHDAMSGMPFPASVTVEVGGETLSGCGGDPQALLARGPWRVTAIEGTPFPADVPLEGTLEFDGAGRVAGKAFCNRFSGSYTLTGEGLSFGPAAMTRMACPEPQSGLESAMTAALGRTTRFDIDSDGGLVLFAGDEPAIRAAPAGN